MTSIQLCLVLHNHQPIGNFDGVIEEAFQDSYLPFLDVFEEYEDLRISLHTSGPLMEWLDQHQSDYLNRVAELVAKQRIEVIGGPYYEPILTMIPGRDRRGQIREYTQWLERRLQASVRGMWTPERVWEQSLTSDLVDAGMHYTVLDDFHFRNAGLRDDQLHGYYLTEDDGRLMSIFPGSERLRYLIPFGEPHHSIDYLRGIAERHPGTVVVFGDDGEKFGTWPDTNKHVYEDGWLRRFFDVLVANRDWLRTSTLAEAVESTAPAGRVYLPDASYREMTEWVMPVERQVEYDDVKHKLEYEDRWNQISPFVRGGFWRNFKVRYTEANEMYSRMMMVSKRLEQLEQTDADQDELRQARQALYRGQCNCSYWHGAFGGIYLPHLRNAVYNSLISADNLLDRAEGKQIPRVEASADDYNFDARREVLLQNDRLSCLLAPAEGGQMYELDVRSICHNLLATLTRRPESYHRKVLAGPSESQGDVASIHDRVVFKQEGLDKRVQYDVYPRKTLVDHFYDCDVTLASVSSGQSLERGDFAAGVYEAKIRRNVDRIQVMLTRAGNAWGKPLQITKGVTLESGSDVIEFAYRLEGLPQDETFHFGVEMNFAGLPAGADDRYFYGAERERLGQLGVQLDLQDVNELGLVDEWLGIDLHLRSDKPMGLWTFPIETVSQSEGGFELVHQSVVVQPHWLVRGDADGRWATSFRLAVDTSMAASRVKPAEFVTV